MVPRLKLDGCRGRGLATLPPRLSLAASSHNSASGEGEQAPAPPGIRQGRTVGDLALAPASFLVPLPFVSRSCDRCLASGRGNFLALSLNDELRHIGDYHPHVRPQFQCDRCGKLYAQKQGALCHLPKCPARDQEAVQDPVGGQVTCNECGQSYRTERGLAQHERFAHPVTRNERRAATAAPRPREPRRGTTVFTASDIERMLDLEVQLFGTGRIAQKMCEYLPGKTNKQIRDRRCVERYKALRLERLSQAGLLGSGGGDFPGEAEDDLLLADPPTQSGGEGVCPRPLAHDAVQVPAIVITEAPCPDPDTLEWVDGVIDAALQQSTGRSSPPPDQLAAQSLLRDALRYAQEWQGQLLQEHVDYIYDLATSYLVQSNSTKGEGSRPKRVRRRMGTRRYLYARTQDLYRVNPGLVAKHVRDGVDWLAGGARPKIADVRQLYATLWGRPPAVQLPEMGEADSPLPLLDVLPVITAEDVRRRLSRMKRSTAAGPDGITHGDVFHPATQEVLRLLFNLVMVVGRQPTAWRMNRTVLLPKEGKDLTDVTNFRPITISSVLSRLYWGIIDAKVRDVLRFTPRQKGFVCETGCFNNVHILSELLRHSKEGRKALVAVVLDINKAFDTIPHQAMVPALRKKGLPTHLLHMVDDAYRDVRTTFTADGGEATICLQRGVKQGDPMSPLLFTAVLEPLLLALEAQPGFSINEDSAVSSLAFADDLVLLAETPEQARHQLLTAEAYLGGLGMSISASKCAAFQIRPTKDSWFVADPGLALRSGEAVPFWGPGTSLSYLGVRISPWAGIDISGLGAHLADTLRRVRSLALKPHQKVDLISTYLVPHYLYQLVVATPPVTLLRELDQELRVAVKDIFHLPHSTTNGVIYSGKRDGGLGFPKLETLVTASTLRTGLKFLSGPDPVQRALGEASGLERRLRCLATSQRLLWPPTESDIRRFKSEAKKRELEKWASLGSHGKSVAAHTDSRLSNAWLFDQTLLKPSRMITALKMRTNTCADRVALCRAKARTDPTCRQCSAPLETLGHILGQCRATKRRRIRRHDEIRDLIVEEVTKAGLGVSVTKEPSLRPPSGGVLKPDLVLQNRGRVFVVDVTVRHEDGNNLSEGRNSKLDKYGRLIPHLRTVLGATSGEVLPIVVGTMGAMPRETVRALATLGIVDRHTLLTISLMALRSSIEIYHDFMDYDRPHPRRGLTRRVEDFRPP